MFLHCIFHVLVLAVQGDIILRISTSCYLILPQVTICKIFGGHFEKEPSLFHPPLEYLQNI